MRNCLFIAVFWGLMHTVCMAQYYPGPPPIDPRKEPQLRAELRKAASGTDSIRVLLDLSNLYFNKPFKKKPDLKKAMAYAEEAVALSRRLKDASGYNAGQLFMGYIHGEFNEMTAEENILPLLNDTAKVDLLLALSYRYRAKTGETEAADRLKGIAHAQKARELSVRLHLPKKEVLALFDIAAIHVDQRDTVAGKELQTLIARHQAMGNRNLQYIYNRLALVEWLSAHYDKALYYSHETIKNMRETGDSLAAGDWYLFHAIINYHIDQFQQTFDYSEMAIRSYAVHAGEYQINIAASKAVSALRKMKKYTEAVEFLKRIDRDYPSDDATDIAWHTSDISDIYRDMKQYDKAEIYLRKADEMNKTYHISSANAFDRRFGQLYVESHQYEKAKPYIERCLAEKANTPAGISYLHYLMFLVDSATGNYLSAMGHLHKNHAFFDTSVAQKRAQEIQKLMIQFETKEKEDKLKLQDKDIALQKQELSRSKLVRNITIGSTILFLIIAFLLFRSFRNKQRSNRIITQKNEALQRLVTEKEWLLKEVHHRVKNNLHTVICLLESQAFHLENDALKAIETSQHRIYAMSMIHQKLYQSDDIKTIDMTSYLPDFIEYLRQSFGSPPNILFQLNVDPVKMTVSQAVPVALIVNEAVTNSIKYAFPDNRPGHISIDLLDVGDKIKLSVMDNGIGISRDLVNSESNSLGLELMEGLSFEMHAEISIESSGGTRITIQIAKDHLIELQPSVDMLTELKTSA